jgi:IS30 family transposase
MGDQIQIDERAKKYPDVWKRDEEWHRIEEIWHWEWDTIIWKNRSGAILTLVERKTWKILIGELPLGKNAVWLTSVLTRLMSHIPRDKIKSITFDNGREFADHQMMQYELKTLYGIDVDIYFAHPYCSWERWTNENTNWLVRQYLPKKTEFTNTNTKQKDLDKIQISLDSRPRKRLGYATPDMMFWWNEKCCVSE